MKGYRCEYLFGDGVTDPLEVSFYETRDLGNSDIPDMILKTCQTLTEEERVFLNTFKEQDEPDKWFFQSIVRKYIGNRNFCKWLCKSPKDIFHSYIEPFKDNSILLNEFLNSGDISEYNIPDDAIVLADLGVEGSLYCWRIQDGY